MVYFYTEPLLRVIQYDGLSLGISKSVTITIIQFEDQKEKERTSITII
jgi:hypothetical protein